jgi:hypothetical protein
MHVVMQQCLNKTERLKNMPPVNVSDILRVIPFLKNDISFGVNREVAYHEVRTFERLTVH